MTAAEEVAPSPDVVADPDLLRAIGTGADRLPRSIAVIMDGNGRWAQKRGLPRFEGHRVGADSVDEIVTLAARLRIEALMLYCFSRENWKRPQAELSALFELLEWYVVEQRPKIIRENLRAMIKRLRAEIPEVKLAYS